MHYLKIEPGHMQVRYLSFRGYSRFKKETQTFLLYLYFQPLIIIRLAPQVSTSRINTNVIFLVRTQIARSRLTSQCGSLGYFFCFPVDYVQPARLACWR